MTVRVLVLVVAALVLMSLWQLGVQMAARQHLACSAGSQHPMSRPSDGGPPRCMVPTVRVIPTERGVLQ